MSRSIAVEREAEEGAPPPFAPLARQVHHNPLGGLLLQADRHGLRFCGFLKDDDCCESEADSEAALPVLAEAMAQLDQYFEGTRTAFDLPCRPRGTEFQRRVWAALEAIPFGATRSYGELACAVDSPQASRAVGAANGRNPLPVIIPCHRVIGAGGTLVGFGGGLDRKRWLLEHERARHSPSLFEPSATTPCSPTTPRSPTTPCS